LIGFGLVGCLISLPDFRLIFRSHSGSITNRDFARKKELKRFYERKKEI